MKESVEKTLSLRKFEENLTHTQALDIACNTIGRGVLSLKDKTLSEHYGFFKLDIMALEESLKKHYPHLFDIKDTSLFNIVAQVYGYKTAISIKKLL